MKKMKKFVAIVLALLTVCSITACKPTVGTNEGDERVDPNRTQIYVSAYNGGYGIDWVYSVKKDFEADNPDYQVMVVSQKQDPSILSDLIASGNSTFDIYIQSGSTKMKELVDKNCFVDLTSVYEQKAADSESLLIKDKVFDYDLFKDTYSKRDNSGIYILPYSRGFTGIVFDFDMFLENGWLEYAQVSDQAEVTAQGITSTVEGGKLVFASSTGKTNYQAGDKILTCGRDGKYGTYDDGQPTTMEAFEFMLAKIRQSGRYNPFMFSTKHPEYHDQIFYSLFATYEGIENFKLFYSFDGTYTRTNEIIKNETGYEVYDMEGIRVGAQFMHDYVTRSNSYAEAVVQNLTFTESQNNYILGYSNSSVVQGAMLIDGTWWENEAKPTFEAAAKRDASRGFGQREYRYLIYPQMEGAYGIDGNGKGTIYTPLEEGLIAIDANASPDIIDACKKFLQYTCRDKYLKEAMKVGCYRPYKFDISESEKADWTPYIKNLYEMVSDTENIKITTHALFKDNYDLSFYGIGSDTNRFAGTVSAYFYDDKSRTVDSFMNSFKISNSGLWSSYIAKMNQLLG